MNRRAAAYQRNIIAAYRRNRWERWNRRRTLETLRAILGPEHWDAERFGPWPVGKMANPRFWHLWDYKKSSVNDAWN
jgi:hypothetical protein